MAQTKKRRRTKHRGNAAGIVETRGRTSRPGAGPPGKGNGKGSGAQRRAERLDRKPTWRGATTRAAIATVFFLALVVLIMGRTIGEALAFAPFILLIYIPLGYYTDLFIYNRRQKRKAAGQG